MLRYIISGIILFFVILVWLFNHKKNYKIVKDDEYSRRFDKYAKKALNRAWQCRDFEIDKLLQRSIFFWGFIVAIFTGYLAVISDNSEKQPIVAHFSVNNNYNFQVTGYVDTEKEDKPQSQISHLLLYLILLGFLFSLAWILMIKGNKTWQLNWEMHIDRLEDSITGPLHKTIFYKKHSTFYSIARINVLLAVIVMLFWVGLLIRYCFNYNGCRFAGSSNKIDWEMSIALIITVIFSIVLIFCSRYPFSANKDEIDKDTDGVFIDRTQKVGKKYKRTKNESLPISTFCQNFIIYFQNNTMSKFLQKHRKSLKLSFRSGLKHGKKHRRSKREK